MLSCVMDVQSTKRIMSVTKATAEHTDPPDESDQDDATSVSCNQLGNECSDENSVSDASTEHPELDSKKCKVVIERNGKQRAKQSKKDDRSDSERNDGNDENDNEHQERPDDTDDVVGESETKSKPRKRSSSGTASGLNTTYLQLCHDAMVALQDRTGSSLAAIKKWILTQHPDLFGPHFNTRVNQALKNGIRQKRFVKVKASFKISASFKEAERAKRRKKASTLAKLKKAAEMKSKQAKKNEEDALKKREAEEKKKRMNAVERERLAKEEAAKEEAARRRAAAEAKAKAIADRIRKRRYPIEDTKLHVEDKQLGVKPPSDVCSRPYLPYFWHMTLPLSDKSRVGKTPISILNASKVDGLDYGSRGLVADLLQVYHFFAGDVHFALYPGSAPVVCEFTLQHLVYATEQVINGNAKKAKLIPPLISHLFVSCFQILWQKPIENGSDSVHLLSTNERKLREDFCNFLLPSLTPVSWPDLCFLYMDAMERYYSSDASRDPSVLQPLPIDVEYLLGAKNDMNVHDTPHSQKKMLPALIKSNGLDHVPLADHVASQQLPDGYASYLGDPRGTLYRAHYKLARQDPWNLTAEELMAILRALTDDILATHPAVSADIASREEKMHELLKAKKAADSKFRKIRFAFEGPKRQSKKVNLANKESDKGVGPTNDIADDLNGKHEENENDVDDIAPFKPTVSRKLFEATKKAQEKSSDAYEKGIRKLVARTEPVGYDRNYNAVYCFRHDPEILYVEDRRSPSGSNSHFPVETQFPRYSWHVIEATSLFDVFVSSLDVRGKRENDLFDELVGPPGSHQSMRRFLVDDIKQQQIARAKQKEKEALLERLKTARIKCDEENGRRSGRLAGNAESELIAIQGEVDDLEKAAAGKKEPPRRDYSILTGMEILRKFDTGGKMETRRSRDKRNATKTRDLPLLPCSKLCATGNIDGTGLVGMIVDDLLGLEEFCESLVPWEKGQDARDAWIARLEEAVFAWNLISSDLVSVLEAEGLSEIENSSRRDSLDDSVSSKRRKVDQGSGPSVASVISLLKQPLLELEERVADVTNVAFVAQDADLADENMSTDGSEEDPASKSCLQKAWKKCVRKIRETPTRSYFRIREHLVAAIAAARSSHVPDVVSKLRAALLLYHPNAAGDCKAAALKVLEEYGDYKDDDDESDDEADEKEENKEDPTPSVLSAEAIILSSCLAGIEDATRSDWITAVRTVKTISRLAALSAAFVRDGTEKLTKLEIERDALNDAISSWEVDEDRKHKKILSGKKTGINSVDGPSEVWANVLVTDEICMAKAEKFPWWPAKKCEPKDPDVAKSLAKLNRCIVALIGEMGGLRVVKIDMTRPFSGKRIEDDEDLVDQTKEIKQQLDDCIAFSRRIIRGRANRKKTK